MFYEDQEFSIKNLFIPLSPIKAIHWIITLGIVIYFNSLFNGFVWDDLNYILSNPQIHTFNIIQFFSPSLFNSAGYYRPIPAMYFSILYIFFGKLAFFYHFIQVALHIVNSCLVFYLMKKFVKNVFAFFSALVFLVHPIQVESVAYIGASQSELFFFFGISALIINMKEKLIVKEWSFISLFLLCSLLTKESGALFFVMVVGYQALFNRKNLRTSLVFTLIPLGLYLTIRFVLAKVLLEKIAIYPLGYLSLQDRLINIPEIIFYYLKTFFYPAKLAVDQLWVVSTIDLQYFYIPLFADILFFLAISLLGYFVYRANKKFFSIYLFFLMWFVTGLAMLLQIYSLDMIVADRWFYFPIVGILGITSIASETLISNTSKLWHYGLVLLITCVVLLSVRTMNRNTNWHDEVTLYTHDITISDNFDIENNLGRGYALAGNYSEAIKHLQKSVTYYPYVLNVYDLGAAYEQKGNKQKAEEYFYMIVNKKVDSAKKGEQSKPGLLAYLRLIPLVLKEDKNKALALSEMSLTDYPNNWQVWYEMAYIQYILHNKDKALDAAQKVITLSPSTQTEILYNSILNNQQVSVPDWVSG